MRDLTRRISEIELEHVVSTSTKMYTVGLQRPDRTVIQAIVKADNEEAAKARAIENLTYLLDGLEEGTVQAYKGGMLDNWEFSDLPVQDVKILKVAEFDNSDLELWISGWNSKYKGYNSYRVTLIDGGAYCYCFQSNNVIDFKEAYKDSLVSFYRTEPVEGFIFELCQPCKVKNRDIRTIQYTYESGNDIYLVLMSQYHNYSKISLVHTASESFIEEHRAEITYIHKAKTIERMLSKLMPIGTIKEKPIKLLEIMLEDEIDFLRDLLWGSSNFEVNDRNEMYDYVHSFENCLKCENVIDITNLESVDIDWETIEAKQKRVDEYDKAIRELGNKLGDVYDEYNDLMTAYEKEIISKISKDFKWGCGYMTAVKWGKTAIDDNDGWDSSLEDDGWAAISANDDGWGSCDGFPGYNKYELGGGFGSSVDDTTEDTEPPTKPKKSSKPKSTKSPGTKGSKKTAGK